MHINTQLSIFHHVLSDPELPDPAYKSPGVAIKSVLFSHEGERARIMY